MNELLRRQETLFSQALALPREERNAYLERGCDGDAVLRRQVEELLNAAEHNTRALGQPAALAPELLGARISGTELPGERIGRYALISKLGEGGAGVVYEAEQTEPVRRRVALKVMKPGTDTTAAIARFEAERQALALMEHPNIARVFDAGTTEQGRLFFAMELVRGVRITEFCDQGRLAVAERLRLFVQVCHAVQHAHQKGIIHRDLKPSNILVTVQDGAPVPKVIDFGIAKARQGVLTDQTLLTTVEQLIGTPAYMSPEQAEWGAPDVDTRSDVYSLGVILYELLTGRPALEMPVTAAGGIDALRRVIREQDPSRPSARVQTLDQGTRRAVAVQRGVTPPDLMSQLRGDLDAIALKSLEKDRNRRYATAHDLAADLERHLGDEPVVARPPGLWYQLGKFARRHRSAVAAGAATLGVLVLASVVSTVLAIRATRAEAHARREATRSAQVARFLEDMLKTVGPSVARGRDTALMRDILEQTASRIGTDLKDEPRIEGEIRQLIGNTFQAIGRLEEAEAMLRSAQALWAKASGPDSPEFARVSGYLGWTLSLRGKLAEAEPILRRAVALNRELFGAGSLELADSLEQLSETLFLGGQFPAAESLVQETLSIRLGRLAPDHLDVVRSRENLAWIFYVRGDVRQAEPLFRIALESLRKTGLLEHPEFRIQGPFCGLAHCRLFVGDYEEAERLAREDLALVTKHLDPNHQAVGRARMLLGNILNVQGEYAKALPFFREALASDRKNLTGDHQWLAHSTYSMANCLDGMGDQVAAEPLYRESLAIARRTLGNRSRDVIYRLFILTRLLMKRGAFAEAEGFVLEGWDDVTDPSLPPSTDLIPLAVHTGAEFYALWAKTDPTRSEQAAQWKRRLEQCEAEALAGVDVQKSRQLTDRFVLLYSVLAKTDPAMAGRAEFWRLRKEELEKQSQPAATAQ